MFTSTQAYSPTRTNVDLSTSGNISTSEISTSTYRRPEIFWSSVSDCASVTAAAAVARCDSFAKAPLQCVVYFPWQVWCSGLTSFLSGLDSTASRRAICGFAVALRHGFPAFLSALLKVCTCLSYPVNGIESSWCVLPAGQMGAVSWSA